MLALEAQKYFNCAPSFGLWVVVAKFFINLLSFLFMQELLYSPEKQQKHSFFAHIAQVVEHFLGKEEVTGSTPVMSSS